MHFFVASVSLFWGSSAYGCSLSFLYLTGQMYKILENIFTICKKLLDRKLPNFDTTAFGKQLTRQSVANVAFAAKLINSEVTLQDITKLKSELSVVENM